MNQSKNFNLTRSVLIEEAIKRGEGVLSDSGALIVHTGKYTGRSPSDKFSVYDEHTKDLIWYNEGNKKMSPQHAENLFQKVSQYLDKNGCYKLDCRAGASQNHALNIRVKTQRAWHNLFAQNMFLESNKNFKVDFEIFHAPGFKADPIMDHTNSECAIVLDFSKRRIVICGTEYAGEIKKSVFTAMNFLLPNSGVLGMHCSANMDDSGNVAIFFGLSGTGKTTLSADSSRLLIGDDEHGWDDEGVFNFEGGCYAKVIRLSSSDEPEIYQASNKFGSVLENVIFDPSSRKVDFNDARLTENSRSSYDISYIPNACLSGVGGHPKHIIMLTCDAFGVLPPIAKLNAQAAAYHFINGYTAKVAGTERGITEPVAVFSPCFGSPFMAHKPQVYAKLLEEKIAHHKVECWLVNTGWSGGPYGVGERMKISWTRRLLHAALDGKLKNAHYRLDPIFNLEVPVDVEGVPQEILDPKSVWEDQMAYEAQAYKLAQLFNDNFEPYSSLLHENLRKAGPILKKT
ncbi:MAG: phosphoenolpyruvate carboxykinase (ATP) [Myxococcales bacterium]|nr:phosphoenolpyruvate carboxykinase (ATP) [Myxococcales bacterium]USN51568.1 MAG: phosphoenolpyruvate carboxykinase (ATP) [Myxococcales bacterium]